MNSTYYQPDHWVVLKIGGEDPHHRVLGGWQGSYLDGDSWRLNSGIVKVEKGSTTFKFYGHTGSVYECGMHNYGLRKVTAEVLQQLQKIHGPIISIMDEDTDWTKVEW